MTRYLVAALWPIGIAVIAGAGLLLVRRAPGNAPAVAGAAGPRPAVPAGSHEAPAAGLLGARWTIDAARIVGVLAIGSALVYGVMALLGLLVVHHGLAIDRPIFTWMTRHEVHSLAALMKRLTKIGNTWTCWGAAAAAGVCLAVTWRSKRWLPPAILAACIFIDHFATLALRHTFHRVGPPTSPFGTYPSGGCDRVILFYGLIAYLLWREFSGQRRTAIWAATAVAALGFDEAYSRVYLSLHWFTDAVSGVLYGVLLLAVFIVAIRLVAGPAARRVSEPGGRPARDTATATRPHEAMS